MSSSAPGFLAPGSALQGDRFQFQLLEVLSVQTAFARGAVPPVVLADGKLLIGAQRKFRRIHVRLLLRSIHTRKPKRNRTSKSSSLFESLRGAVPVRDCPQYFSFTRCLTGLPCSASSAFVTDVCLSAAVDSSEYHAACGVVTTRGWWRSGLSG